MHPWSDLLHFYESHHDRSPISFFTLLRAGIGQGRASFIVSLINVFLIKIETKVEENCKANSLSPYFSFLRFIFWKKQDYRYIHCKSIQFKNMMDDLFSKHKLPQHFQPMRNKEVTLLKFSNKKWVKVKTIF